MKDFKVIALTHKKIDAEQLGCFYIQECDYKVKLNTLKTKLELEELMYLSTCNRTEFLLKTSQPLDNSFLTSFFKHFQPEWPTDKINWAIAGAVVFEGESAIRHLFKVASSLDSLVVGEREIITQVKKAYNNCKEAGITGDTIRLAVQQTIITAKKIYTETAISRKSVSVVSLAYHKLRAQNIPLDARFLIIGAGKTNTAMANFLKKHGYADFTIFNRTLENAEKLAEDTGGKALPLSSIAEYKRGFDVLITCTGAEHCIIDENTYRSLTGDDNTRKTVIDLAVPNDFDLKIANSRDVNLLTISDLRTTAAQNLKEREKELDKCYQIIDEKSAEFDRLFRERQVELAMRKVPDKVKEIHQKALNEVFAGEINNLDEPSKAVLDKVLKYVEKKYISMPMRLAKEILLENNEKHLTD